jgi:hypothetical protein
MSKKKSEGANTQTGRLKRITYPVFIALIAMLILLSISSFLIVLKSKGEGSQLTANTEMPTPTPTPTSIYLETPPAQSQFYDTFKNNALGWSVSSTAGFYRTVQPGQLTLLNTNRGSTLVESLPTNSIFDNCTVIVDFTISKIGSGDSIGLYFRGDTSLEHDYRLDLNGNGTYDIAKEYLDSRNNPQVTMLVGPKSDSALNSPGKRNTIILTMNGSQLQLIINNIKVGAMSDSDYVSGQVALFAHLGGNSQDVAVSFSRVEIDKLPGTPSA